MKQSRKEQLLHEFPATPSSFMDQMKGRGAMNFVVFLIRNKDSELFARCYHRYADGKIIERQRYVYAKDGAVRYGKDDNKPWEIRKDFREPVFCQSYYGYAFDNSYVVLNAEVIKQSCLKYALINTHSSWLFMSWLKLYIMHPNTEYLVKAGYSFLISEYDAGFYGGITRLETDCCINWKSNNLLKMLGLNRSEFKALQAQSDAAVAAKSAEDLVDESTAELERNIAEIDTINMKVRANLDKAKAEEEAKGYGDQYLSLTSEIENVRKEKYELLHGADLPLPGLSVEEGELTFEGQKWDNMSGSQQLRVATAIVRRLNPECGFVLLDKLEQMDTDTLREFGSWLESEGLQAIATRVSLGEECSIIIEDGYIAGDSRGTQPEPIPVPIPGPEPVTTPEPSVQPWNTGIF